MSNPNEVKRYESKVEYSNRPTGGGNSAITKAWMRESDKGDWVKYSSYQLLEAKLSELKKFARHDNTCRKATFMLEPSKHSCSCGLDKLLGE